MDTKRKQCGRCLDWKPVAAFNRHRGKPDGFHNWCRHCMAAYNKHYRVRNPLYRGIEDPAHERERLREYPKLNPEKMRAHAIVQKAILAGTLVRPAVCPDCQRTIKVDAHHEDYDKPLEVQWKCRRCHKQHHRTLELVV